jgi:hypothetical protein
MFDLDVGRDDMICCCTTKAICDCSSYICNAFNNSINLLRIIWIEWMIILRPNEDYIEST